ncbi:MAG: aminoacyl-tRNA hydrolase [Candidatus Bipolaricaulaceae bacterium]
MVGLGNPGLRYAPTRHNLGYWVLERLLAAGVWSRARYAWGEVFSGPRGRLLRPLTYMNRSGEAVAAYRNLHRTELEELLVVYDDVDLPVGEVRLQPRGGPGSHRGMRSVVSCLGTEDVPRLRVGVGAPPAGVDLADYVLAAPAGEQVPALAAAADLAAELAGHFLAVGLRGALDAFARARQE